MPLLTRMLPSGTNDYDIISTNIIFMSVKLHTIHVSNYLNLFPSSASLN